MGSVKLNLYKVGRNFGHHPRSTCIELNCSFIAALKRLDEARKWAGGGYCAPIGKGKIMSEDRTLMLRNIHGAVAQLRRSGSLHDLGMLQHTIRNTVAVTTPAFEPAYAAVTELLVSVRNQYVDDLSDVDFLDLVKKITPDMLEVSTAGDDCDEEGDPIVDGEEVAPAIDGKSIDSAARRKFAVKAGFRFCDDVVLPPKISAAQIDALSVTITELAIDNEEELLAAWRASAEVFLNISASMRMTLPKF